jgi:hypothetical protein
MARWEEDRTDANKIRAWHCRKMSWSHCRTTRHPRATLSCPLSDPHQLNAALASNRPILALCHIGNMLVFPFRQQGRTEQQGCANDGKAWHKSLHLPNVDDDFPERRVLNCSEAAGADYPYRCSQTTCVCRVYYTRAWVCCWPARPLSAPQPGLSQMRPSQFRVKAVESEED